MQFRHDQDSREPGFASERDIGMVKQHEQRENGLIDQNDLSADADNDDKGRFKQHRQQHLADVKADTGKNIQGSIAVVHLMEHPQEGELVISVVPPVEGEIEQHKRDRPLKEIIIDSTE